MGSGINAGGLVSTYDWYKTMDLGLSVRDNSKDNPFSIVEKDNCKILQYELVGLNKHHITVQKEFVNKTKTLYVTVEGKYEDRLTGWKNDINIKLQVDYNLYNKVTWNIQDGILNVILHEIVNEEPEFIVNEL